MSATSLKISSIGEIRAHLASAIKSWNQQTSDLTWPEDDDFMAEMDGHIATLRTVNAQLALIENLAPSIQKSLALYFNETWVQDPGKFARFAEAVGQAAA